MSWIAVAAVVGSTAACSPNDEKDESPRSPSLIATVPNQLPRGLVCGLSYVESSDVFSVNFGGGAPTAKLCVDNDIRGKGFGTVQGGPSPFCDGQPPGDSLSGTIPVSFSVSFSSNVHDAWQGACNGVTTVQACGVKPWIINGAPTNASSWYCFGNDSPSTGYDLHVAYDAGDAYSYWVTDTSPALPGAQTAPGPWGFAYQAYFGTPTISAAIGTANSDQFVLPKGTACGLAHTRNRTGPSAFGADNSDPTCMGFDPLSANTAQRCPPGWSSKYMFDMSSGNGTQDCGAGLGNQAGCGFWAWCEYQDPHNLCDEKCARDAVASGVATNLSSNTDSAGQAWCGTGQNCPCYGGALTPSLDQGRGSGEGLQWCGAISAIVHDTSAAISNVSGFCASLGSACHKWNAVPDPATSDFCENYCIGEVGCFADAPARVLPVSLGNGYTVDSCEQAAANLGYAYAGVEFGGGCFVGNSVDGLTRLPQSSCNMACTANGNELCGGTWAIDIYRTSNAPGPVASATAQSSSSTKVPSAILVQWTPPATTASGYAPLGYHVYRGGDPVGHTAAGSTLIATTTSTAFWDQGLADAAVTYNIRAYNALGESDLAFASGTAHHCDTTTCNGCCSGNTCLAAGQVSTGCASGGNVCAAACPAGDICSGSTCACAPIPMQQACANVACGSVSNGCGGTINCGACSPPPPTCRNCVTP